MEPTPPPANIPPAQIPPAQIPPANEPPQYAQYPRGYENPIMYGSYERLKGLGDGYYGVNQALLAGLAVFILGMVFGVLFRESELSGFAVIIGWLGGWITFLVMTIRSSVRLGVGVIWKKPLSYFIGFACGLAGIIGSIVLQTIATTELKNYGIISKFFGGLNKKQYQAVLEEYRIREGISG